MRRKSCVSLLLSVLLVLSVVELQAGLAEAAGFQDSGPPVITTEPSDLAYEEGTTGHSLHWEYSDENLAAVDLYLDHVMIFTDPIGDHPTSLTRNIDGLSVGVYNYTLYLDDIFVQSTTSTVFVTVTASDDPPIVSHPFDLFLFAGMPTNNCTWTGTDSDPDTYRVYLNGTEIASGPWSSGTLIIVPLSSLQFGVYNLTIVMFDDFGNTASDTVIVYVLPSTIVLPPPPFLFETIMIICIGITLGGVVLIVLLARRMRKE